MNLKHESFMIVPMTREHAETVCGWVYEPPYDLYGWLPWDQMEALGVEFGDPEVRQSQYVSVLDAEHTLCGFAQFFPLAGVTRLGVGMRPDLCGQGLGKSFMQAVVGAASEKRPGDEIDLEVHTWNKRAIRAYRKSGFVIADTYPKLTPEGEQLFHCMVYKGDLT